MKALTMNGADADDVARTEKERLQATPSGAARWAAEHWWFKRFVSTAAHPGSIQHRIAAGVVASLTPRQVETHLRAGAPRRDDA